MAKARQLYVQSWCVAVAAVDCGQNTQDIFGRKQDCCLVVVVGYLAIVCEE